ncbi:uncharacterized protein [Cicer arietinum]|uniref:Uncharacterized protein LOC101513410 isoform X2 n=1 Tax=Cicer arietinum TaxID=3827 RepID=A0A1S3EDC7_CICAR|nr:uncharacterized protein LOC101513410 isoform X2 [Cicer arietinum]
MMYWLKRTLSKSPTNPAQSNSTAGQQPEQQHHGITDQLINHVKSFTIDTFKNFPLQDEDEATYSKEVESNSTRVRNDLSQWQERHAVLILSTEISHLRYVLCPRHLKENQFWKIYFTLTKSHLAPYELRAIQQEKLKQMAMEDDKSSDNHPYEIEMAEAKHGNFIEPLPPS